MKRQVLDTGLASASPAKRRAMPANRATPEGVADASAPDVQASGASVDAAAKTLATPMKRKSSRVERLHDVGPTQAGKDAVTETTTGEDDAEGAQAPASSARRPRVAVAASTASPAPPATPARTRRAAAATAIVPEAAEVVGEVEVEARTGRPQAASTSRAQGTRRRGTAAVETAAAAAAPQLVMPAADGSSAAATRVLASAADLERAVAHLRACDAGLAALITEHGLPHPLVLGGEGKDKEKTCFAALAQSIIYQQLSGKVAQVIHGRFMEACQGPAGPAGAQQQRQLQPADVLAAPLAALRAAGLSGRKAEYLQSLAQFFDAQTVTDDALRAMDHTALVACLTAIKGVGKWTVDMLAMFHLGRADVLPEGDLGVRRGVQVLYGLRAMPDPSDMERLTAHWAPYRSVASWYMWRIPPPPRSPATKKRDASPKAKAKAKGEGKAVGKGKGKGGAEQAAAGGAAAGAKAAAVAVAAAAVSAAEVVEAGL